MDKYYFDDSLDAKGKQKHAHFLNDVQLRGTTTVLSVIAKPLTYWASGLAVGHLGWMPINNSATKKPNPYPERLEAVRERFAEIKGLSDEEYLAELDTAYKAHAQKLDTTATAGTNLHAELEKYVKFCLDWCGGIPSDMREFTKSGQERYDAVAMFSDWACANVKRFIVSEAHCYSKETFTGGIVDLVYEDENGYALLDFKSAKEAYDSHFLQNAAYDLAISENGALTKDGIEIWRPKTPFYRYSVLPFGMPEPQVIHNSKPIEDYKRGFCAAVELYRVLDKPKF